MSEVLSTHHDGGMDERATFKKGRSDFLMARRGFEGQQKPAFRVDPMRSSTEDCDGRILLHELNFPEQAVGE